MHIIDVGLERSAVITEYGSRYARALKVIQGAGETHVHLVYLAAGGAIGLHVAGFGQLFLVVAGTAWVAGEDGSRREVHEGEAAVIARGEMHAKGSEAGCTAVMIQIAEMSQRTFVQEEN
jgi:quercetin dioxygenase-like cupin family protein